MTHTAIQLSAIDCPQCGANLPDWTKRCPFCKHWIDPTLGDIPGPCLDTPPWVWYAYYGMAILWIVGGAYWAVHPLVANSTQQEPGWISIADAVTGWVSIAAGIGLISRIELMRGVVNVLCWLQILLWLVGAVVCIALALEQGAIEALKALASPALHIASAVFMIYLIAETDRREPNL